MPTTLFDIDTRSALQKAFEQFDKDNPHVWNLFVQFAFRAIRKGFNHYGAKTIFEAIRYHSDIVTKDKDFKLNNDYTAYYARKFEREYPEHRGFFRMRKVKDVY